MKTTDSRPKIVMSSDGSGLISHSGALLLLETLRVTSLDQALSEQLRRWRPARAIHDPGKIIADLAVSLALGGDCLADIVTLRSQPQLFGPIASDPTASRLIDRLATDTAKALTAIRCARAIAREHAWTLAGPTSPGADGHLIPIDLDATIVIAHSDKENATPTGKKTFGFHPMTAFADHGPHTTGEPLTLIPRPGNASSNTAADHITATRLALTQLPKALRRHVLIRTDSGGGTHEFLTWLTRPGQWLKYSIGFTITDDIEKAILRLPATAWTPAYDADGQARAGAWVAEITAMLNLTTWPAKMRVIVRKERPHPGARPRFTDAGGHRFTCFVTNTPGGQLPELELRHRRRARAEDRIRTAKDTGLRNLPLHDFTQNRIWCEIVALACDLISWTQLLALNGPARRWEPKRLRLRLFAIAGRLVRGGRQLRLRIAAHWPWTPQIIAAVTRLPSLTRTT
ncbi:IS1380 family transposase [Streptosporangium sp. NPDC000095]|uniref:IS1380 family transposase n=1 Tax=Streptosporangium sp. NPDC000095 TaxID=3366184 RepID=UPI00368599AD